MFGRHFFKRLKVQMASSFIIASMAMVVLIGFILYYSISIIVLNETLDSTKMALDKSGLAIESYIDKVKGIATIIADAPSTRRYLSADEVPDKEAEDILSLITTTMSTDKYIASIIIVGKDGQLISNEKSLDMSMSSDMMKEPWYVAAIESGSMPTLTSARMQKFDMDKMHWVISLSREIKDENGANIGVLVVDFKYSVIEAYLANLNIGKDGYAFIMNSDNEVVYHKDTVYFEDELKREVLMNMATMDQGYDANMNRLFYQYALTNTDWTLFGVASLDGLDAIRQQLIETIILVGLAGLLLLMISTTFIAGRITNPIKDLEEAMNDIESGLQTIEVDGVGCYEAQSLANHYNEMVVRIKNLLTNIADQEKSIRSYELNVLHSQINPHFLYNTLDTIVWMAEFGDGDKVVQITKALAQFFRLSLSGGSDTTTVKGEIDHVRQYLFIQKERYGDQLVYEIHENPNLGDIKIPKILLQPIVENAIYHGIRQQDDEGLIEVSVLEEEEDLLFVVKDNGCGFDLNQVKEYQSEDEVKLGGVGIKNVDQRIHLSYGDGYGVTIESKLGQGTTVTLRLKKQMKMNLT